MSMVHFYSVTAKVEEMISPCQVRGSFIFACPGFFLLFNIENLKCSLSHLMNVPNINLTNGDDKLIAENCSLKNMLSTYIHDVALMHA